MMKKLFSILLCAALILSLGVLAFAEDEGYLIDKQGFLSDETSLELLAQEVFDKYGIAVCYCSIESDDGLVGAERAQRLYEQYISAPDGILLLDCAAYPTYYMYYSGKALDLFAQGDGNAMMSAYNYCATYDEAVRAYLVAADTIISERMDSRRDLLLLDDLSDDEALSSATAVPMGESSGELPLLSLEEGQGASTQPAPAAEVNIPEQRQLPLVVDTAGALDPAFVVSLNEQADILSEKYGCDVSAVLIATTGGRDIQAFTDDFYDYNGYGYGPSDSGIMFCVAVQDRKFAISTYGPAAYSFSDYGQAYMDEVYLPYLRNSDWGGAISAYLRACGELLEYERVNGRPYDIYAAEEDENLLGGQILISVIAGFIAAFIPIGSMKRKMLNVQKQTDASDYVRHDSFHLSYRNDRYITSQITKVRKPRDNDNTRSSGGGGTSFHVSSSGRSHGGHSGSF